MISMQFLGVLMLALIAGLQQAPELHSLINAVRADHNAGEYTVALEKYNTTVKPLLPDAPKNLEINARLLEVYIFRSLGYTDRGLDSIKTIIHEIPPELPRHKMQAFSHQSLLEYDSRQYEAYKRSLLQLYQVAEQHQHGNSMSRAIGNLYYYYDLKFDQQDSIIVYLDKLEQLLHEHPSHLNQIRYHVLTGRYLRDYADDWKGSLTEFGKAAQLIEPAVDFNWFEILIYEQTKTWLANGNSFRAEQELNRMGEYAGTFQSPNVLFKWYSAMVRMSMNNGNAEMAREYFRQMELIPRDMLDYEAIESGVLAKIALNGGDFWESDPIFKYASQSEINYLWMVWVLSGLLGVLLFRWLFPARFSWLQPAFVHPQGPIQRFQSTHPPSQAGQPEKSVAYLSASLNRLRSLRSRQ